MLRALPISTFDDVAALGLEVTVYCPSCHRETEPIDLTDARLRGRSFAGARFVCHATRQLYDAIPPRTCGALGHIRIRPRPADRIVPGRSMPYCSISCPRCVPCWEIDQAAPHLPPWDTIWAGPGVRLACPACRSALTTVWHGGDGIPFSDGYRRESKNVAPLSLASPEGRTYNRSIRRVT